MTDDSRPLLVYDRIAANRRRTLILLGVFAMILLPFTLGFIPILAPLIWFGVLLPVLGQARFQALLRASPGMHLALTTLLALGTVVTVGLVATMLQFDHAVRLVLRVAGARPVRAEDEPELRRVVENLCIGAGLPPPRLYTIESSAPNAFAAGLDPSRASLAVTRGLLQLLDRRELQGVIAHELSHVGNQDTRLGTMLAAIVATLRLPLKLLFSLHPLLGAGCLVASAGLLVLGLISIVGVVGEAIVVAFVWKQIAEQVPRIEFGEAAALVAYLLYAWLVACGPFFVLLGAQLCGLAARGGISRQREFLADADAVLLTQDPEGLARALVKIDAATGEYAGAPTAAAHLFIVDPVPAGAPWWDRSFPSHPPIEERVAVLARMGTGISPAALRAAADAAARVRQPIAEPPREEPAARVTHPTPKVEPPEGPARAAEAGPPPGEPAPDSAAPRLATCFRLTGSTGTSTGSMARRAAR